MENDIKRPKRPCKEPGCNNMGFIAREEGDNGPLIECPRCVTPYRTEVRRDYSVPKGTKRNNWDMPIAEQVKPGVGKQIPARVPKTKATESRIRQNEQAYGFQRPAAD